MTQLALPKELKFPGAISRGARGKSAKLIQEWLCLNNHAVAVDSDFGPATETALKAFQNARSIAETGKVNKGTFEALTAPMAHALGTPGNLPKEPGAAVAAIARRHLAVHPREVGGQNCGPWVRLYMDGHEGNAWPWCAGFVSFVIKQASVAQGRRVPFPKTYSCDVLAGNAAKRDLFVRERDVAAGHAPDLLPAGTVFLNRRVAGDWTHTGFVIAAGGETFTTIEGNTNDEGSREGYEVCARTRGYGKKDFARITPLEPRAS